MRYLKTNTAVIVTVGPFYDKTDGVTIETSLTITNERITITADTDDGSAPTNILDNVTGATSGTDNDLNYITGNDAGMMQLELSAANTNRLGRMFLSITDAANHVPVFHEFMVLPAVIYDSLILGTDLLQADVTQLLGTAWLTPGTAGTPDVNVKLISDDATAANNAESFFDGTGYAGTNNVIPLVTTTTTATTTTNLTNLPAITANWLTAAGTAADFTTEIQTGLATAASIAALNNISTAQVNAEVDTALADIHLDHLFATTYDPASKPGAADALLNELIGDDAGVSQYTANALELAPTGGSAPTVTQIRQEMDSNSTQLAAIVADTNELQTDWANGGRLDLILDARSSQTSVDDLPTNAELATALGTADDATLAAIAALNDLNAAEVRTAVGLATANLDTQLDALPTAVENADALLNRDLSTGTDSGSATVRTVRQALRFLRNKWAVSGTTLTVYKEDDSTASWTGTVSTDAAADPVTGNDPASS